MKIIKAKVVDESVQFELENINGKFLRITQGGLKPLSGLIENLRAGDERSRDMLSYAYDFVFGHFPENGDHYTSFCKVIGSVLFEASEES